MSALLRTVVLTVVLAFAAGLGGAWLGVHLFTPAGQPSLHTLVHGELKLSPDQQSKMDQAETAYNAKKEKLQGEIAVANRHLAETMKKNTAYGPEVERAVDEVHFALGELQKETIKYVYDMRGILTEDQAKQLDDRVFQVLTRED